ncbi:hypothetical protein [Arsukibacterium indicum]|uniref:DUF3379 domain-containing protein n=1 Tax=Arsukibacterium indicum TaxID=2848612 RepID=A0ABS6MG20_9GAMM|nr:hypothetical protein [Arsukibacterium indicum]MBV2127758.1 hypothetical protein [Arsukibacterium indicum]
MSSPEPADLSANKTGSAAGIKKAYQALKAEQPLPAAVKQQIMQQAKQRNAARNWRSWWYFTQLALGCAALVLVLSWVNPAKLPVYYQIDTMSGISANSAEQLTAAASAQNDQQITVQWHHLTASATGDSEAGRVRQRLNTLKAQQKQLQRAGELSNMMQSQIGLLTRQQDSWQIVMCNNTQLNMAIELVQELSAMLQVAPVAQPQWVELQFASSGHILAIAAIPATRYAGQCPAV